MTQSPSVASRPPAAGAPPTASRIRRRWGFRLTALGLGGLLAMLFAEGLLRVYVASRGWTANCYNFTPQLLVPDPVNGYRLAPDVTIRSGVFEITTNRWGLRGPPLAAAKPAGTRRVALLGGSSVFGYSVSDGQEAARHLESRLRQAGHPCEVINAGVPGYNLYQTTERLAEVVMPLAPDLVVLYLGWNDMAYVASDHPEAESFRRLPVASARERVLSHSVLHGLLVHRLGGRVPQFAPPPTVAPQPTPQGAQRFTANLQRLADLVERADATLVVCSQVTAAHPAADPRLRRTLGEGPQDADRVTGLADAVREMLRETAARRGAVWMDAAAEIPATPETLADAIHLTAAGEAELAAWLVPRLAGLLPARDPEDDPASSRPLPPAAH